MFVAFNRHGILRTVFRRSYPYIERLKMEAPFYCPDCKGEVILKAGKRKLPHFAHKTVCPVSGEGETLEHMIGKVSLYEWLKRNGFSPRIEIFLPEINQRPDVFFHWNGKKIAVEFQYSPIPYELVKKRTEQYEKGGMIPIWIIHKKRIRKAGANYIRFTDFSTLFIQQFFFRQPYLLSFDPCGQVFFRYTYFLPVSKQRAIAKEEIFTRRENWVNIFHKPSPFLEWYDIWAEALEKWLMTRGLQPGARKDPFLLYFYRHRIHPTMLPPEIGIPLPNMYTIVNPPFEWQSYLWHRFFYKKNPGDSFSKSDIHAFLFKEMRGIIHWRTFPLLKFPDKMFPIWQYFRFFVDIGTLRKEKDLFIIRKPITPIVQGKDGFSARKDFFRRYKGILLKTWLTDLKNKYILFVIHIIILC